MQEQHNAKTSSIGELSDETHEQCSEAETCEIFESLGMLPIPPQSEPYKTTHVTCPQADSGSSADTESTHEKLNSQEITVTGQTKFPHTHEQVRIWQAY